MPGTRVAHYEIVEQIGAGGMGVVYRAIDTRLSRPVALKTLPASCVNDRDRRARFEREARLLAALDHPNIGGIYGVEDAGEDCFLVLEFIPGLTLAERLHAGTIPVPECLDIARQIAAGLEAAHERGIIHRDLKPANVKLAPDGAVKLLDFGLGKSVQGDSTAAAVGISSSPTETVDTTCAGYVLGTAAYMSPEQARGASVDKRADIWAFGCVFYEMLAGRRAFAGESPTECVAAVLTREPEWSALPPSVPPPARAVLRHCLQKDPRKRLRDIGDARLQLEEHSEEAAVVRLAPAPRPSGALWAAALLAAALLGAAAGRTIWRESPVARPVARFTIQLPRDQIYATTYNSSVSLSPDGTKLAYRALYEGVPRLFLRPLDSMEAKPITGTEGSFGAYFSPDNQWLIFGRAAPASLRKVALSGGGPVTFTEPPVGIQGLTFRPGGDVLFCSYGNPVGVYGAPMAGGRADLVAGVDADKGERAFRFPQLLPDGEHMLVTVGSAETGRWDDARIVALSMKTKERRTLVHGGMAGRFVPPGYLVYARSGALLAVPFDVKRLAITGPPVTVIERLAMHVNNGVAHFSLSDNGDLAYAPGAVGGADRRLVWVDRRGQAQPLPLPPRGYLHPRLSPDSRRIAVEIEGPNHDLWLYDMERGILGRLTTDGQNHWPLWTPDGKRLTFRIGMPGPFTMWWIPADRSAPQERLTSVGLWQSAGSWSPDGKTVVFTQTFDPETDSDIYVLELGADRKPRPFVRTRFAEGAPRFSPDGQSIAYVSNESGRNEIYVQPYPGPGPTIQLSVDGGTDPVWPRNAGELFYRNGDMMMAVAVTLKPELKVSRPALLWEGHYSHGMSTSCGPPGTTGSNYDVSPNGQKFLMISDSEMDSTPTQINVVLNWVKELKRLMRR